MLMNFEDKSARWTTAEYLAKRASVLDITVDPRAAGACIEALNLGLAHFEIDEACGTGMLRVHFLTGEYVYLPASAIPEETHKLILAQLHAERVREYRGKREESLRCGFELRTRRARSSKGGREVRDFGERSKRGANGFFNRSARTWWRRPALSKVGDVVAAIAIVGVLTLAVGSVPAFVGGAKLVFVTSSVLGGALSNLALATATIGTLCGLM